MILAAFASAYCDRVEASTGHRYQLLSTVRGLSEYLNVDALPQHLNEQTVNGYVAWLRARGRSDSYRRGRLNYLKILWRDLADDGLIAQPRRSKLTRVRVADHVVKTMRIEQVRQLLAAAESLDGEYRNGIPKRLFWGSYVRAAWDTGLRGCDLLAIPASAARGGVIAIVQRKTGKRIAKRFNPRTLETIRETLPPHRPLIWPLWASSEMFRREAAAMFADAGLSEFTLRDIRSASGTMVDLATGEGHEHLGNTRKVFERHYLDQSHGDDAGPMPPEL